MQNSHQNAGGVNPGTGGRTAGQHLGFKVGTAAGLCFSRVLALWMPGGWWRTGGDQGKRLAGEFKEGKRREREVGKCKAEPLPS